MIDIDALITGGIGLLTTISTGIVSWILARKKYQTEVEHNYLENLEKALETYDSIISHNKNEIEALIKENLELREELSELRKQVLALTMNICMDLTCARRLRENQVIQKDCNGKSIGKLDETELAHEKD